jgi:hypothetical protein
MRTFKRLLPIVSLFGVLLGTNAFAAETRCDARAASLPAATCTTPKLRLSNSSGTAYGVGDILVNLLGKNILWDMPVDLKVTKTVTVSGGPGGPGLGLGITQSLGTCSACTRNFSIGSGAADFTLTGAGTKPYWALGVFRYAHLRVIISGN